MKTQHPLLCLLAASGLLFAGNVMAQQVPTPAPPMPPPSPMVPMPPMPPAPPATADSPATPAMPAPPPVPAAPPTAATPSAPPTPPVPSAANPDSMGNAAVSGHDNTAVYPTPQGELTVHSQPATAPSYGPAPAFAQLAGNGKAISEDQAVAYPPLANDFLNADRNRNGNISAAEYSNWSKQP